ncbi:MAG: RnfABCDGE type electron transport complex subunit D [Oscillospiraceae bacterium]|nr:RnfABCDGE type electron transport complex subunit D [Oscillospiraceae bacterium]
MKLNMSISPHVRDRDTTRSLMLDVAIALIPSIIIGIYYGGWRAALVVALSVGSCVLCEFLYDKLMHKPNTIGDCSAVVTGLILACNLYSTAPIWLPILGGAFAIIVVKMLYGGLGQNFMNPACAARCFLLISFPSIMTNYPALDGVSSATPLTAFTSGESVTLESLLLGNHIGTIGETSVIAILVGFIYLICRRVISPKIPVCTVVSAALFIFIFGNMAGETVTLSYMTVQLLSGGLLFGAVFMATDYVTAPVTNWGQVIYAVVIGLLVAFIRCFGGSTEGMSYAIIIANLLTPLLEKATQPRPFGVRKEKAK